jgi:Putative peptidoglycan binding domain
MVSFRNCQVITLGLFLLASPAFATRTHRAATAGHSHKARRHAHVVQGQRGIDPDRATQIQNALIREHYLTAPASGQWDSTTESAMQKFQADHGWQTKLTPDSRALIKLGLGPKNDAVQTAGGASGPAASGTEANAAASAATASAGTLADAHAIQN